MGITHIVTMFMILVALTLVSEPLAKLFRLPNAMVLVIAGFVFSEIFVLLGFDTGIRAENFHDLIFVVLLPLLIFEAAFKIDFKHLAENSGYILFLAIFGLLITIAVTAAGLFYGIGHARGFPWQAALLTGALLAATDPVAVVAQLKALGAPKRLAVLLEGESLFNDATAIVVFSLFLSLALMPADQISLHDAGIEFLKVFAGGVGLGLIIGLLTIALFKFFKNNTSQQLLTLLAAYSAYLIAEKVFHVSGVVATLIIGLSCAWGSRKYISIDSQQSIHGFWDTIGHLGNAIVFLVMGITITLAMFEERWQAMLIGIAAVTVARAASIYFTLPVISRFAKNPIPFNYQTVMVWGGLRGAVTLALALSLPVELEYWWTIQSIAFGVTLFTLFIQAPTTGLLIRRLAL